MGIPNKQLNTSETNKLSEIISCIIAFCVPVFLIFAKRCRVFYFVSMQAKHIQIDIATNIIIICGGVVYLSLHAPNAVQSDYRLRRAGFPMKSSPSLHVILVSDLLPPGNLSARLLDSICTTNEFVYNNVVDCVVLRVSNLEFG